jgi:hypothetical protein
MRPTISYVVGYGLHVGRLLWWPPLMLASLVVWPIFVGADLFLRLWTGYKWVPFGLIVPLFLSYKALRRYYDLRDGGVLILNRIFKRDGVDFEIIRAEQAPERFASLLRLESWLMGSIVVAWSVGPLWLIVAHLFTLDGPRAR